MRYAYFSAPLSVGVPAQDGRRFAGVLYGGGVITDHPTWESVVLDLQTMKVATPIPLLFQHRHEQTVGVVRRATIGADIRIEGDLFTGIDEKAAEIAAKADSGMNWQMSVGLFLGRVEQVAAGKCEGCSLAPVDGRWGRRGPFRLEAHQRSACQTVHASGEGRSACTRDRIG